MPSTAPSRPGVSARAVRTLGALGLPGFSAHAIAGLGDPPHSVAMVSARSLCSRRNPECGAAVLWRADLFQAWSRGFLASMLAGAGTEVAPHLRQVLGDPAQGASPRAVSADALRRLADLEELSLRRDPRRSDLLHLFGVAVVDDFGYRQLSAWWRLKGTWSAIRKVEGWGAMRRKGFAVEGSGDGMA